MTPDTEKRDLILDKRVPIRVSTGRKTNVIAGYISYRKYGEGLILPIFWKPVDRARHYMRIVKGYGIQETVYNGYIKDRRGWVLIKERDDKFLLAEMIEWDKNGRTQEFIAEDGAQRFLSEKFMKKLRSIDEVNQFMAENPPERVAEQPPLLRFP